MKTIPFTAADTYIADIWQYSPTRDRAFGFPVVVPGSVLLQPIFIMIIIEISRGTELKDGKAVILQTNCDFTDKTVDCFW